MVFTISNNPIDKLLVWLENKTLQYTHWYFNRKPQYVRCAICGETLSSRHKETPSPEECGWQHIGYEKYRRWICHRCDAHRNLKPYIKLADLDEELQCGKLCGYNRPSAQIIEERNKLIKLLLQTDKLLHKN